MGRGLVPGPGLGRDGRHPPAVDVRPEHGATPASTAGTTVEALRRRPAAEAWFAQPSGLAAGRRPPVDRRLRDVGAALRRGRRRSHTVVGQGLFDFGLVRTGPPTRRCSSTRSASPCCPTGRWRSPTPTTARSAATTRRPGGHHAGHRPGRAERPARRRDHLLVVESAAHRLSGSRSAMARRGLGPIHHVPAGDRGGARAESWSPSSRRRAEGRRPVRAAVAARGGHPTGAGQGGDGRGTAWSTRTWYSTQPSATACCTSPPAPPRARRRRARAPLPMHQQDWGVPVRVVEGGANTRPAALRADADPRYEERLLLLRPNDRRTYDVRSWSRQTSGKVALYASSRRMRPRRPPAAAWPPRLTPRWSGDPTDRAGTTRLSGLDAVDPHDGLYLWTRCGARSSSRNTRDRDLEGRSPAAAGSPVHVRGPGQRAPRPDRWSITSVSKTCKKTFQTRPAPLHPPHDGGGRGLGVSDPVQASVIPPRATSHSWRRARPRPRLRQDARLRPADPGPAGRSTLDAQGAARADRRAHPRARQPGAPLARAACACRRGLTALGRVRRHAVRPSDQATARRSRHRGRDPGPPQGPARQGHLPHSTRSRSPCSTRPTTSATSASTRRSTR